MYRSPFTTIAAGVDMLPQTLYYPYSLITKPREHPVGLGSGLNELIPGWVFNNNIFGIWRNTFKFDARGNKCDIKYEPNVQTIYEFLIFYTNQIFQFHHLMFKISML